MAHLTSIAANLWETRHVLRMGGAIRLPCRMTVVQLPGQELLLHSPVPIGEELAGELGRLGSVAHIVAPNLFHHLYLRAAAERFPDATLYAAPGLARKRRQLPAAHELGVDSPPPFAAVLQPLLIDGMPRVNEVVFLHRPTGTLIVTDLLFHIEGSANWASRLMFRLMGTGGKGLTSSRLFRAMIKDRGAAAASVHRLLELEFSRVVVAHGSITENASYGTREALAPFLR